jgi:predicted O-methyltransferase YrrM
MTEQAQASGPQYVFTNDWFSQTASLPVWRQLIRSNKPTKILEIGSFEGRSTCWLIENCTDSNQSDIHVCCVDSWEGGIEHQKGAAKESEMSDVEKRFDYNLSIARSNAKCFVDVRKIKKYSQHALPLLMSEGKFGFFDLIYIDGSHQAPDVLTDAIMSFQLLAVGGVMIFDDYLWSMDKPGTQDPLKMPKPAIDAFFNIFQRKMSIYIGPPINQIYARKVSD